MFSGFVPPGHSNLSIICHSGLHRMGRWVGYSHTIPSQSTYTLCSAGNPNRSTSRKRRVYGASLVVKDPKSHRATFHTSIH